MGAQTLTLLRYVWARQGIPQRIGNNKCSDLIRSETHCGCAFSILQIGSVTKGAQALWMLRLVSVRSRRISAS